MKNDRIPSHTSYSSPSGAFLRHGTYTRSLSESTLCLTLNPLVYYSAVTSRTATVWQERRTQLGTADSNAKPTTIFSVYRETEGTCCTW